MNRNKSVYSIDPATVGSLKARILDWASQFGILAFFDNNEYPSRYEGYECIAGVNAKIVATCATLAEVQTLHNAHKDWMFGHICYEFKDVLEPKLYSNKEVVHGFPLLHFFVPETVIFINRHGNELSIETFEEPDEIFEQIALVNLTERQSIPTIHFTQSTTKAEYVATVDKLRNHIAAGDCYEINYCIGAFAQTNELDTISVYRKLNSLSPAPFAAFYKMEDKYLMCASPERYLMKKGSELISQPIKGTAPRGKTTAQDENNKQALLADLKERAENIMITDLVRNDLARCCETGSIQVDELFGIYSYPQVHQMISTVSGKMTEPDRFTEAIKTSFPMGSMTGAPKHKVMQLTEAYETIRRELYSGTVGYITPQGDFDFNVVIRSLFYNAASGTLSWCAGGAITWDSVPEKEWDEMRLKAWALERIFAGDSPTIQ